MAISYIIAREYNKVCIIILLTIVMLHYLYTVGAGEDKPKFGPNLNEFVQRFDAATTKGQGESVCH